MAVVLVGCQEKKGGSVNVRDRAQPRTTNGVPTQAPTSITEFNGVVFWPDQQQHFLEAIGDLMAANLESPEDLGFVSAAEGDRTGVYFAGRVQLTSGPLRQGIQSQVASGSQLVIGVFDEFSEEKGPLPQPYFVQAQGQVSGNTATIRFFDDNGWVELRGQFDSNVFQGDIYYDVRRTATGQEGRAGPLGHFKVPTCRFFICG